MERATRIPLTRRQEAILRFIQEHIHAQQVPPTVREIGARFEIGPAGVFGHLKALERKGQIRRADRGSRAIEVVSGGGRSAGESRDGVSVPVVGRVAAGQPILAEERIEDHLWVDGRLAGGAELFALRVSGQSMIGAGILDGDYVIARQQQVADDGDIVVALIGDEATVKRLRRRKGGWRLDPENPDFEPITVTAPTMIQGKVVAVYRRLD
ncbi:MAG: transcriptional repressor LexA [Nitrospirota bacterium]